MQEDSGADGEWASKGRRGGLSSWGGGVLSWAVCKQLPGGYLLGQK